MCEKEYFEPQVKFSIHVGIKQRRQRHKMFLVVLLQTRISFLTKQKGMLKNAHLEQLMTFIIIPPLIKKLFGCCFLLLMLCFLLFVVVVVVKSGK